MRLEISTRKSGDISILDLRGRSTIGVESELLSSRLNKLVDSGVRKLVLNLVDLTQLDSSGIRVIVETCVSLRRKNGDLKLLYPCGLVLEVLTVLRLLGVIESFEEESQALGSFRLRNYPRYTRRK